MSDQDRLQAFVEQLRLEFDQLKNQTTSAEYQLFEESRKELTEDFQLLLDRSSKAGRGPAQNIKAASTEMSDQDRLQALVKQHRLVFDLLKNGAASAEYERVEAGRKKLIEDLKVLLHRTRKANRSPTQDIESTERLQVFVEQLRLEFNELKNQTTAVAYQRFEARRKKITEDFQLLLLRSRKANGGASQNIEIIAPELPDQDRLQTLVEQLHLEFDQLINNAKSAEYKRFEAGRKKLTEELKVLLHRTRRANSGSMQEDELQIIEVPLSQVRSLCLAEIFPEIESLRVPIGAINELGGHPNKVDLLFVAAMAAHRKAERIFEFGTYTGRTTYHLASATPQSRVWTLNIPPEDDPRVAPFLGTYFRDTEASTRITQLFSDSRKFDTAPYKRMMDFIFVDADHSYDLVKNDTERALEMLAPGGLLVWHDYAAKSPGVVQFVQEFSVEKPVFHIRNTCLAVYMDGIDAKSFTAVPLRPSLEANYLKQDEEAFS